MYYLNDKRAAVREVQKYLNSIYGASRHISESGFFDEGTKAAVIEFQKQNELLPTGAVNNETFSALYREYKRVNMRRAIKKSALTITFPIKRNDLTEEIRIISKKSGKSFRLLRSLSHTAPFPNFYEGNGNLRTKAKANLPSPRR